MTQKDKDLLYTDLCARLPYSVKVQSAFYKCDGIIWKYENEILTAGLLEYPITRYRPYLFPLSSITEEQSMELFKLFRISLVDSMGADYIKINDCTGITFFLNKGFDVETHLDKLIDWLHKNHFDYRGLIEKGLSIDATELDIY